MVEILYLEAMLTPSIAVIPAFPQIVKLSLLRMALECILTVTAVQDSKEQYFESSCAAHGLTVCSALYSQRVIF